MNREKYKVDLPPRASFAAVEHQSGGIIVHPTDYSAVSRQAFELACRIARERGSRLVVMHVAEPVTISSIGMAPVPPLPKGYRGAWESRLRLLQSADPTVGVEHRLEEGDIADAILRVARETQCDLIVMANSERTWLGRLFFGSVTTEVERKAPCPVLSVDRHQLEVAGSTGRGIS
jgi:nucleotide-binding universal stress UspA family protein